MKRLVLILSSIVLLASIFGVVSAFSLPSEIEAHTTLLSYEHEGSFDYLVYLKPSYLFDDIALETTPQSSPSKPKYPIDSIDTFDLSFAYHFVPDKPVIKISQQVEVKAVLDREEVILVPTKTVTGDFTVNFSLDANQLASSPTITITANVYVTVETDTGPIFETFTQSLAMQSNSPLLEVDKNLTSSQDGSFGGLSYEQIGVFDYSVRLKADAAFSAITLKPPSVTLPIEPSSKILAPGDTLFSSLIDKMDVTFSYKFKSRSPVTEVTEEVTVTAILENPEVWSKTFVLMPRTKKSGEFTVTFPLDINHFTEMLETIQSETGVRAESYNLTIKADVHTVAQTDFRRIDEVFSQTLSSTLGKGTLEWNEELIKNEAGSITVSQMIPNPNKYLGLSVGVARYLSATALGIFLFFFLFSAVRYVRLKPTELSHMEKEVLHIRKKYGKRIAEIMSQTPVEGEKIISLGSMEDLIKVAYKLLKPIIHQVRTTPEEAHGYYVFDGATRYEYLLTAGTKEQASNAEKTE